MAAQDVFQGVEKGAGAALDGPRRADARQATKGQAEIEAADVHRGDASGCWRTLEDGPGAGARFHRDGHWAVRGVRRAGATAAARGSLRRHPKGAAGGARLHRFRPQPAGPGQSARLARPSAGSPSTRVCAGLAAAARAGASAGESIEDSVLRVERTEAAVPDGAADLVADLYRRLPEAGIRRSASWASQILAPPRKRPATAAAGKCA